MRQAVDEVNSFVPAGQTEECLRSTPLNNLSAASKKLSDKIANEEFVSTVTAASLKTLESGVAENLQDTGYKLLEEAITPITKNEHCYAVALGVQCTDEAMIEYDPAYLVRAYNDAVADGLAMPVFALGLGVHRFMLAHAR